MGPVSFCLKHPEVLPGLGSLQAKNKLCGNLPYNMVMLNHSFISRYLPDISLNQFETLMLNRFSEWIWAIMNFGGIHAWFLGFLPLILWERIKC